MAGQQGASEESWSGAGGAWVARLQGSLQGTSRQGGRAVPEPCGRKGFAIPGSHPGSDTTLLWALGKPLSFSELSLHLQRR